MKKIIACVLALLLLPSLALAEAFSQDSLVAVQGLQPGEDPMGLVPGSEITIGTRTDMSGYFAMDLWTSNTVDVDIRALLHAYSTVTWVGQDGVFFDGMVVAGTQMMATESGNRVYIISLMTDLLYNDGSPITAEDYVFSLLLTSSPLIREIGGVPRSLHYIEGFDAYAAGETAGISGVRLLSPDTFSIEIREEMLPYFYGLSMLEVTPYPMHVIAPGCRIADDRAGAFIEGDFTAELLLDTMMDPEDGYVFFPRVTSGPYQLESYDRTAHTASFVVNPHYRGNYEGISPHIEHIHVRPTTTENALDLLLSGEIDILNKTVLTDVVSRGITLSDDPASGIERAEYLRSGYAYIGFACETGPTASAAVRRAIAHCLNKETFVRSVSPYAEIVHGYYGAGQWMASYEDAESDELGIESGINIAEFLPTLATPYDLDAARALLVSDGWVLNMDGGPFTDGVDRVRYREEDGVLVPLMIRAARMADNDVATKLDALLLPAMQAVGIGVEVTMMSFKDLLAQYYRTEARTHHMFFLGSNFMHAFDPYFDFHTGDAYQVIANPTGLRDEELMNLALDMRQTKGADLHEYIVEWMAFQKRFVELMPTIPLYSNRYFDFYRSELQNYHIEQSKSWAYEVPLAWVEE